MSGMLGRTTRLAVLSTASVLAVGLSIGPVANPGPSTAAVAATTDGSDQRAERRGDPRDHKFLKARSGRIIHWSHCRRINLRVNYDHAPRRSRWHVKEAVRRLNRATGMHYRYMGPTSVRPTPTGGDYPRGTRLVVGWARPANSPLKPGTAGVGGPTYLAPSGAIVRGFVIINYKVKMAPGFGKGPRHGVAGTRGQVLMHELAHTAGLAHVGAKAQIMYTQATRKKATWGAGDWRGLRKQGRRAGCR
jgi:hypothetical protein